MDPTLLNQPAANQALIDRPLRVLLIDDDQDDYFLTRDLLIEAFGPQIELEWAARYQDGLRALRGQTHDVCLLDYRLEAKTGLELLGEASLAGNDTPVILLTGQGQREVDMQAMQAGAADFLTKEALDADELERAVRHAMERHRDRIALRRLNAMLEVRVEERTRELERANQALQEADRRKDEFLATLAHELRNPLAPISNALELIGHCLDDRNVCEQSLATMKRQLDQLVRLTDDLLEVSRISRGKVVLRPEPLELAAIVDQAVEAARPLLDARQQLLQVRLRAAPLQLRADPTRLAQVLGNLLNNASKFTGAQGRIELAAEQLGPQIQISVRDDGIGIHPDQLDRIFDMFAQVESSLERSQVGLGIGLTLVKSLVELHGGTVEARSAGLGHGSEFIIRLPVGETSPTITKRAPMQPASPSSGPGRRILVVDDNRDSAISMAMLLKLGGHRVTTAFGGQEALEKVAAEQPQIILLDIGLPDINGYEVARRLRQGPLGDQLILIALTGWGQEGDRSRSVEAGINHHLLKPVDYQALQDLLGSLPTQS